MAKKYGLGTALLIGAAAAAVAGGVISYIKRAEIKRLADDIITRVKPTDARGVYTVDFDGDGRPDAVLGFPCAEAADAPAADAAEPNIVDSGISLESAENTATGGGQPKSAEAEAEPDAAEPETETADTPDEAQDEAGTEEEAQPEEDAEEQGKKRFRFWSK